MCVCVFLSVCERLMTQMVRQRFHFIFVRDSEGPAVHRFSVHQICSNDIEFSKPLPSFEIDDDWGYPVMTLEISIM